RLWEIHDQANEFARERLNLELKPEITRVVPVTEGVAFLGMQIFPGLVRFDPPRARRWRERMRSLQRALDLGLEEEDDVQRSADSLIGWARHADSLAFRRAWAARRADDGSRRQDKEARTE
ncbi:MAG: hypothetical protein KGR26_12065, partial [Cyanobacteria bacterium REEB65]|nr:hypothetical protein [Cyanobacteria bacterium REEB65]